MNDGYARLGVSPSTSVVDGHTWLAYPRLDCDWLVHGTVVFRGGDFGGSDSTWREELATYMRRNLSPAPRQVVIPTQIHGNGVTVVHGGGIADRRGRAMNADVLSVAAQADNRVEAYGEREYLEVPACDGLVTRARRVVVGVNTADCVPLFAVNQAARTLGIAHCGWRGIAAGVIESMVDVLGAVSGAKSEGAGTIYVIGASVGRCCYEVGDDLLNTFSAVEVRDCSSRGCGRKATFDLKKLVRRRLTHQGIDPAAIFTDNTCTSCLSGALCSYRAAGAACGRMYSFLMIA